MSTSRTYRVAAGTLALAVAALGAATVGGATPSMATTTSATTRAVTGPVTTAAAAASRPTRAATARPTLPGGYKHLVVIYEENHSFDNLYGHWGKVHGQRVRGIGQATAARRTQVAQDGTPLAAKTPGAGQVLSSGLM